MLQYRQPNVKATIRAIEAECGYRLDGADTDCGNEAAGAAAPCTDLIVHRAAPVEVRVFPAFAADMALLLESNLGTMAPSSANLLVAEREYHRVCRRMGVRIADQATHRQHVLNAFFYEGELSRVGLVRTRMPRWLLRLGEVGVPRPLAAC